MLFASKWRYKLTFKIICYYIILMHKLWQNLFGDQDWFPMIDKGMLKINIYKNCELVNVSSQSL